ncbi:MAG: CHAP domain-containing protein [Porcipelethomonas sp.]
MINAIYILPTKTASCPLFGDKAIAKKMNVPWGKHKVGDIVMFDFNGNGTSDHTGIVIEVSGNTITTIEGNTGTGNDTNGGQVQKRTRSRSVVNYFVRPKYNDDVTVEMVIATAKAEVGYKESPKNSNKTKYGKWIGADGQPWCCSFVCWIFAHVKTDATTPVNQSVKSESKLQKSNNVYAIGKTYTIKAKSGLNVRTGAGTKYAIKKVKDMTADGKTHCTSKSSAANAVLKKGTRVTVQEVKKSGKDTWIRIPSGWICAVQGGAVYVK